MEIKILDKANTSLDVWNVSSSLDTAYLVKFIDQNIDHTIDLLGGSRKGTYKLDDKIFTSLENKSSFFNRILSNFFLENQNSIYKHYPSIYSSNLGVFEATQKIVQPSIFLFKDSPNAKMLPHYDNRATLGTILINLSDNNNGTYFHEDTRLAFTNPPGNDEFPVIYESFKQKNKGVFILNSEKSFHSIVNTGLDDRYMLSIVYTFKLFLGV